MNTKSQFKLFSQCLLIAALMISFSVHAEMSRTPVRVDTNHLNQIFVMPLSETKVSALLSHASQILNGNPNFCESIVYKNLSGKDSCQGTVNAIDLLNGFADALNQKLDDQIANIEPNCGCYTPEQSENYHDIRSFRNGLRATALQLINLELTDLR